MDIKDILLVLQAGDGCEAQLAIAARLARENDAQIDTVCVYPEPDLAPADCFGIGRAGVGDVLVRREEEIGRMVGSLESAHRKAIVTHGYGRSWSAGQVAECAWTATHKAKLADVAIAGLPGHDTTALRMAEALAIHSGAPCLFAPSLSLSGSRFSRVLLAWDGSREAKRAMDDGLAIMRAATAVSVVLVDEGGDDAEFRAQGEAVRGHLARHGAQADIEVVSRPGERVGEVLLKKCATFDADLPC